MAIVQTAFVGDVIFASPLAQAIKSRHPQARLALVVRAAQAEVASCIPGVDEVVIFDKRGADRGPVGLWRAARRLRGRFDVLLSLHRSTRSGLLAYLSGIPLRVGFRQGPWRLAYHRAVPWREAEPAPLPQYLRLLEAIGIPAQNPQLRLQAPPDSPRRIEAFRLRHPELPPGPWVALCIGSVWATKRWPAVYFASLAALLSRSGYHALLLGGPGERDIESEIRRAATVEIFSDVGGTLSDAAALLSGCAAAVGGDSGLAHMARALGIPTVVLFGPTDARAHLFDRRSRPLTAQVKCRPCSRHGPQRCPKGHHDCMRLISPQEVAEAVFDLLSPRCPTPRSLPAAPAPLPAPRPETRP
ncbi:MAG: lipopolysaccharide heptosyltransferase II [Myxococcales bacterium]|nr:lipopolysaccharide heptosyltransferase II [Myxococcales bacterium]